MEPTRSGFGIGLMVFWAIEKRPELLEAAIEARPFLLPLSFGSPAPYVERLHQHGILLATSLLLDRDEMPGEDEGRGQH